MTWASNSTPRPAGYAGKFLGFDVILSPGIEPGTVLLMNPRDALRLQFDPAVVAPGWDLPPALPPILESTRLLLEFDEKIRRRIVIDADSCARRRRMAHSVAYDLHAIEWESIVHSAWKGFRQAGAPMAAVARNGADWMRISHRLSTPSAGFMVSGETGGGSFAAGGATGIPGMRYVQGQWREEGPPP